MIPGNIWESRSPKTHARQSELLYLHSLVQWKSTRWSTSKVELEGAAVLICSECQTNSDTCLPSVVKTGSRSKTQGFLVEGTHTHTPIYIHRHTTPLLEDTVCNRDCKSWPGKQWHDTIQHTQVSRRTVGVRNSPWLGDADHLRCKTPQGTRSHEHVWWYGRAWGHQWWLGKWKYPASLETPVPVCFFHPRLGLLLLDLAQHVAWMAPWPKADYEPPSSFCHDATKIKTFLAISSTWRSVRGTEDGWVWDLAGSGRIMLAMCLHCETLQRHRGSC